MILFIIVFIFGLMQPILGVANTEIPGKLRDTYHGMSFYEKMDAGVPNPEHVKFYGRRFDEVFSTFLMVFRAGTGDFVMHESITSLPVPLQRFYWVLFVFMVVLILVIFLNFVVAKAMASHAEATERMEAVVNKEKADMIDEV